MKRTGCILAAGVALAAVCSAGTETGSPSRTVEIEGSGGRAVIDLQGGRILSWKTPSGEELLFMPQRTESTGGDWSHGGISICWPWFGKKGDRPSSIHGFARNRRFEVRRRDEAKAGRSSVTLGLSLAAGEDPDFPFAADLELTLRMAKRLEIVMRTQNTGNGPFSLSCGIQPYFAVSRYGSVTLSGVKASSFAAEDGMDAAFPRRGDGFSLRDAGVGRELRMHASGNTGVVVWSPGNVELHNRNLEAGDTLRFIGLGPSCRTKEGAITLASGKSHELVFCVEVGAAVDWKVPNWCPIVTEEKAVLPWIGKTWSGHVQGMCVSSNALYFSFHDQIVKTDWYGRFLKRVEVDVHGGDICHWNGKLYTGVWLKPKVKGEPWCGAIGVYDAETLEPLKLHKLDWHHGSDGITCLDGIIYMNMGRYAPDKLGHKNWYGKFKAETLAPIGEPFIVDHGDDSSCGSQNMTTDGTYIYSSYYTLDETANTPNLIVYDRDFNIVAKHVYGWNHGMDVVPGGRDGAVRFAFCYTPNWMHARQQPSLPVQGVVKFAELKDGRFTDISRYGVFDKQIER